MVKELWSFYSKVVGCENHCKCTVDQKEQPPRGFLFAPKEQKDILIVALNPHRMKDNSPEMHLYQGKHGIDLVNLQLDWVLRSFEDNSKVFHKNLLKALEISTGKKFGDFNYTNLVKCSTLQDWGKLKKEDRERLMMHCFATHFQQECQLLKPKMVLTYGKDVFKFLQFKIPNKVINLPRRGRGNYEQWLSNCEKLRKEIEMSEILNL